MSLAQWKHGFLPLSLTHTAKNLKCPMHHRFYIIKMEHKFNMYLAIEKKDHFDFLALALVIKDQLNFCWNSSSCFHMQSCCLWFHAPGAGLHPPCPHVASRSQGFRASHWVLESKIHHQWLLQRQLMLPSHVIFESLALNGLSASARAGTRVPGLQLSWVLLSPAPPIPFLQVFWRIEHQCLQTLWIISGCSRDTRE